MSFRWRNPSMYAGFCFENQVSDVGTSLCMQAGFCFENYSALGEFPMEEPMFICRVLFWKFLCTWWVSDEGNSPCIQGSVLKITLHLMSFRCTNLSMFAGFCFENHLSSKKNPISQLSLNLCDYKSQCHTSILNVICYFYVLETGDLFKIQFNLPLQSDIKHHLRYTYSSL